MESTAVDKCLLKTLMRRLHRLSILINAPYSGLRISFITFINFNLESCKVQTFYYARRMAF